MHKERIPLHKKGGFLCRKRRGRQRPGYVKNTSGPGRVRKGMKEVRASRRSNEVRVARGENTPQHIIACQGAAVKGNIPRGGIWGWERIGGGNVRKCAKASARDARAKRAQRGTRGGMSTNEQRRARASAGHARGGWVKKVNQD